MWTGKSGFSDGIWHTGSVSGGGLAIFWLIRSISDVNEVNEYNFRQKFKRNEKYSISCQHCI